jgi:hypothetical protein
MEVTAITEHDRQVSVHQAHLHRRGGTFPFIGRTLDQRAETDSLPMVLEDIAEEVLQEGFLSRQRPDFPAPLTILSDFNLGWLG